MFRQWLVIGLRTGTFFSGPLVPGQNPNVHLNNFLCGLALTSTVLGQPPAGARIDLHISQTLRTVWLSRREIFLYS